MNKRIKKKELNITVVWTRDLNLMQRDGRISTLFSIRKALISCGNLYEIRQPSVMDRSGKVKGAARMVMAMVKAKLQGEKLPIQCALFDTGPELIQKILATCPDVVVLDSIRQVELLREIRRSAPNMFVVLDMDDLMSRRFELLLENNFLPSLGMFSERLPRVFARLLQSKLLSSVIMRYEALALKHSEAYAVTLADKVVMVSQLEASMLQDRFPTSATNVLSFGPPVLIPEKSTPFGLDGRQLRFAFVGSDKVVQNATTIDELLNFWERYKPCQELWLFGNLTRHYGTLPANVVPHGFVEHISDVYDGRTVLITPTRLAGGVKTKFLEAFAYRAPVIGSALTFEGVLPSEAYLTIEKLQADESLFDEARLIPRLIRAAELGNETVRTQYSRDTFIRKWISLVENNFRHD